MSKRYDCECFIDGAVFINTENDCEFDMECACELLNEQDEKISDLESELAESKECVRAVIDANFRIAEARDKLKQQLVEQENRIEQLETGIRKIEDNKNKEVQEIREFWKQRYKKLDDEYNQDKISFAVEQLEKVKEWINNNLEENYGLNGSLFYVVNSFKLSETIDNQIKQLKEME